MKPNSIKYVFIAKPWKYTGPAGWVFVSLPVRLSKEIRKVLGAEEEGWGRLKAIARTGNSEWKTAIWFDTKKNTYLLPLKAEIRMKEKITLNRSLQFLLRI